MAIGTSLLLTAIGAILALAINTGVSGVDIQAIGGILSSFAPFGSHDEGHHGHV